MCTKFQNYDGKLNAMQNNTRLSSVLEQNNLASIYDYLFQHRGWGGVWCVVCEWVGGWVGGGGGGGGNMKANRNLK